MRASTPDSNGGVENDASLGQHRDCFSDTHSAPEIRGVILETVLQ